MDDTEVEKFSAGFRQDVGVEAEAVGTSRLGNSLFGKGSFELGVCDREPGVDQVDDLGFRPGDPLLPAAERSTGAVLGNLRWGTFGFIFPPAPVPM